MFTASDARNAWAHPPLTGIASDDALRYLDAIHQLLLAVKSNEAAAVKGLHQEQVRVAAGVAAPTVRATPAPEGNLTREIAEQAPVTQLRPSREVAAPHTDDSGRRFQRMPTHRDRISDFISKFPGRDDDEIASTLGISPRQTVNMICRKLAEEGVITRQRSPSGKLVTCLSRARRKILPPSRSRRSMPHRGWLIAQEL
jgi:hypothetical protein